MNAPKYANVTGGQRVEAYVADDGVSFLSGLLQKSSVVNASIPFSGGTIHVVNRLLTLPQNFSTTGIALNLTSAVGAVEQVGWIEELDNTANLTMLLPDNAAFQRVGENLANLSTANLMDILSYHVIAIGMPIYSTDVKTSFTIQRCKENKSLRLVYLSCKTVSLSN